MLIWFTHSTGPIKIETREAVNCTRKECPGRAVWQPILSMRTSVKSPEVNARFRDLAMCEGCMGGAKLTDFISTSTWDKIVRFMQEAGKPAPRRHLTTLRWEMVDSPESTDTESLPF